MALRLAIPPSGALAPSRDASLQVVRRLDWRFLLPEPRLDRVAYLGPGEDPLLSALRACSQSLAIVPDDPDARGDGLRDGSFEVAVVQSPRPRALARAAALPRRGGWLYCELSRPAVWNLARLSRHRGARDAERVRGLPHARALLEELGFGEVEAHWHYPDFERCAWLVPVDPPAAVAFFLARAGARPLPPLAARIGGRILAAGVAARALPCVSLIAHRGGTA